VAAVLVIQLLIWDLKKIVFYIRHWWW